ncbi:glycolate oxidase iron-sulfur subunit [Verrucomicrobium sp. GAS474]|uniref:(Fe-S)-binding protein n=1 Tax=Verrucomicrobium sp. GAS474 TaxID=1882831 RepID=UPI00087CD2C7|nr:(Fe-S)-binding protein [Verrucomicrobium sp. GAS474]SDT92298.1 glycolate oxidase iron-sulfur subunit [Verrucomicrobium sp. GAS474]
MSEHASLKTLDYAVLQQCMHCGMCLPTCPTYDLTKQERNSPRGRISLMRAIADGRLDATEAFGDEMYYCLGCLACETACPAGVDYGQLFETARAEVEHSGVLASPKRSLIRNAILKGLFTRPRLLRLVGRGLRFYQASGMQKAFRALRLNRLLPGNFRGLEAQTPTACAKFSPDLIAPVETPAAGARQYRVGLLTGCVQDILFSDINRDTADVLLANGCEVITPPIQACCGSLHAHNGELETAGVLARRLIDSFDVERLDAVITNAAGCGSHLKTYGRLLADDPAYAARAKLWDRKLKDIHQWLGEIGFRKPAGGTDPEPCRITYHEACHLCHGQKITKQPRDILRALPGVDLVELPESTWCCGSAGIYNITQPETAAQLQTRKIGHIAKTGAATVATANPGCHLQIANGLAAAGQPTEVAHPITLLARAYRAEKIGAVS